MSERNCFECRHYRRERTGPHEWAADCALSMVVDFMNADQCAFYWPGSTLEDEGERWPLQGPPAEVTP